ncbi:MAG: phosphotransferase [Trueperaceae bacterium]
MRDAPELPGPVIVGMLRDRYGIASPTLEFLPLGNDSGTFVYRVESANGRSRFLKLRALDRFRGASLLVPRHLHERGVPNVLAPVPAHDGAAWVRLGAYVAALYPFLAGRTATEAGLSTARWRDLGATLRQVHDTRLPATLRAVMPSATFTTEWHERFTSLETHLMRDADLRGGGAGSEVAPGGDPVLSAIVTTWREHTAEIRALIDGADTLERHMRETNPPHVLCHADFHTWNVVVDDEAGMWIVDWDEVVLAPKERDLMFVVGGIGRGLVQPDETASFMEGYGETEIDPEALTYYRYAWALRDIGAYVGDALGAHGDALGDPSRTGAVRSEAARWDAAKGFALQFDDGNMVEIALGRSSVGR